MDEDTGMIQSKLVSRYDLEYTDEDQNIKTIEGLSTIFNKDVQTKQAEKEKDKHPRER